MCTIISHNNIAMLLFIVLACLVRQSHEVEITSPMRMRQLEAESLDSGNPHHMTATPLRNLLLGLINFSSVGCDGTFAECWLRIAEGKEDVLTAGVALNMDAFTDNTPESIQPRFDALEATFVDLSSNRLENEAAMAMAMS